MTQQRLHSAMAPIDVLTREEMEEVQLRGKDALIRDLYRGVDYKEVNGSADGALNVVIPGPASGYAWSVKVVSFLTGAAVAVNLYMGENDLSAPVGTTTTANVSPTGLFSGIFTFTSNIVVIKDGRSLFLEAFTGGAIYNYKILVKQVPTEMVAKL